MKHSFKLILLLWSNKFLIRLSIISVLSAKSLKKGEIVGSNSKLYIAETETEKPNSLRMTFCHAQKNTHDVCYLVFLKPKQGYPNFPLK